MEGLTIGKKSWHDSKALTISPLPRVMLLSSLRPTEQSRNDSPSGWWATLPSHYLIPMNYSFCLSGTCSVLGLSTTTAPQTHFSLLPKPRPFCPIPRCPPNLRMTSWPIFSWTDFTTRSVLFSREFPVFPQLTLLSFHLRDLENGGIGILIQTKGSAWVLIKNTPRPSGRFLRNRSNGA